VCASTLRGPQARTTGVPARTYVAKRLRLWSRPRTDIDAGLILTP
jgi:hypothetical protein